MPVIMKHSIASGLVLAMCITFFIQSLSYPPTAARLPQILIVALAILAIAMFVEAVKKQAKEKVVEKEEQKEKINVKRVLVFGAMIVAYVFLLEFVGYFILTPLFTFGALMYLKATKPIVAILISIIFPLFIYALFSLFLNVPVPKGIFF